MYTSWFSGLAVFGALSGLALGGYSLPATAVIDQGVVAGTTTLLPSATATVNKFLGIPFAAPPQRFSPPTPPAPFNGTYNATAWKSSCLQQFSCQSLQVIVTQETPFTNTDLQ